MCNFQHGTIECRGDGYCWDADHDGYDPNDHSLPCPACNTKAWLEQQKEEAESCISFSGIDSGTGVDIWEHAVKVAERENPDGVEALLREIGEVNALFENAQGETQSKRFVYPGQGMSVLADSLLNQTPGAVPMIVDVGMSSHNRIIAPSGSITFGYVGAPQSPELHSQIDWMALKRHVFVFIASAFISTAIIWRPDTQLDRYAIFSILTGSLIGMASHWLIIGRRNDS